MAILDLSTQEGRDAANKRDRAYQTQFSTPAASTSPPRPKSVEMAGRYMNTAKPSQEFDYKSILNTALSRLQQPKKQFSWNPDSDNSYIAAMNTARQNVRQAQANTNARLRATGQGKSSYSETVANQIAQQAEDNIANNIRPMYEQQAYNRFLNEQNQERQDMQDMLTIGQGFNTLDQQEFNNAISESSVTGRYYPPAVTRLINQVLDLKRQAEAPGVTPEQMADFKNSADAIRNSLRMQYGVDANELGIGYENDYNQAVNNAANFRGIPTMEARAQEFNQGLQSRNQDLNETQVMAQLTGYMPDGTPTNATQRQQLAELWQWAESTGQIPDTLADMYGMPRGTPTLQARQVASSIANAAADNARAEKSAALQREEFEWRKSQSGQGPKQQALTSYTSALNQRFLDQNNEVTDINGLELAILNLPVDSQTKSALYNYYGIPME